MNKPQKQRLIFIVIGIIIASLAVYLSIDAFKDKASLFQSPQELSKIPLENRAGKPIRLGGLVKEGSIKDSPKGGFNFTIIDFQSEIDVYFSGLLPDLFREGQGVYIDGHFDKEGKLFIATELLAKHDETYTPPLPGEGI
ncbi:MAG: cytochrome c-type biogenesis protein CcmE [Alphaproteobacteria bacterium]|jgi:cytochrome c-type biogenesis protein CcmE